MKQLQAELAHKTKAIDELMAVGLGDTTMSGGESLSELKAALSRAKLEKEELALKARANAAFLLPSPLISRRLKWFTFLVVWYAVPKDCRAVRPMCVCVIFSRSRSATSN